MNKERDIERRWVIINRLFLFLGVAMLATVLLREFLLLRQNISFFDDQLYEARMLEITQEVDNRVEQIESTSLSINNMFAGEIESHVELSDFYAMNSIASLPQTATLEDMREAYIQTLADYNDENDELLFFAMDPEGNAFLSDVGESQAGDNYLDYVDPVTGDYVIRDFIEEMESRTDKSGFITYHWIQEVGGEPVEKTSYIKYNEELDLFVGSGMYSIDYKDKVKQFIYNEFVTYYSLDNYVYVIGYDGEVLYHPSIEFDTSALLDVETIDGEKFHTYVMEQLQTNESVVVDYDFGFYGEDVQKTGYIRSVDGWNLYIGRSFVMQDLDVVSANYVQSILPGFIIYNISMIVLFLGFAIVIRLLIYSNFDDVEHMFRVKNEQLKDLSFRDQLTHLYNRQMFVELMHEFTGNENQIAILMFDANGLKMINDTYGHKMGDELLVKLSDSLRETFKGSYIFRWGGDEFVVVVKDATENEVMKKMEAFRKLNSKTTVSDYKISASIGFALDVAREDNIYEMLDQAEKMMYDEKTSKSIDIKRNMIDHLLEKLYSVDQLESNHSKNVVKYSLLIGGELGFSVDELNSLRLSSLLHDVGKIGIPKEVLLKESELNDEELELVRNHSEKGYRILSSYSSLAIYAPFVLSHHEWFNGKGYPQGLSGKDIPLISRIISISDAFDAMVSVRTYKARKTYEEAMEELDAMSGSQFDPKLVKIFKKAMTKDLVEGDE